MNVFSFLQKRIYNNLPLIREHRKLREEVIELAKFSSRRLLVEQNRFISDLLSDSRYANPLRLHRHERQIYSQNGEDGVIEEIFNRVGICSKLFVEIGTGNGLENNTAYLLLKKWKGWWIDADRKALQESKNRYSQQIAAGDLTLVCGQLLKENSAQILRDNKVPDEIDLLSIDVDYFTYEVWSALEEFSPRVVVIEYNATFPPCVEWHAPHLNPVPQGVSCFFGGSLKALERLGNKLGYCLVGCELTGVNAFFVRKDLCESKFAQPYTSENHYEPPRYWLIRREGHAV